MTRILAIALLALSLGGCQLPSLNIGNAVSLNTVSGIVNAYGVVLAAENSYKALPLCLTGTKPSATNICAKRSVIVRLQAADVKARTAINNLVAFEKAYPTLDITNVIAAAQQALNDLQAVLASGAN